MKQEVVGHKILIIQCDCGHLHSNLIACARHKVIDEIVVPQTSTKDKPEESDLKKKESKSTVHVVFIVQLPRKAGGTNFVGFQGGDWLSVHLDDLRPLKANELSFQSAIQCSISEIFNTMYQSVTSAASEKEFEPVPSEEDIVPVPSKEDIEPVPSEKDIEPVASEEDIEPVPSEEDIEPVQSEEGIEPVPSEEDIEPVPSEEDIEPVRSEEGVEPVRSKEDIEPVPSEEDIEPVPSEEDIEPVPSEDDIEPVQSEEGIEPVPSEEDIEPVRSEEGIEPVRSKEDIEPVPSLGNSWTLDVTRNKFQFVSFNANRRLRDLIQMACSWLYDTEQNRERTTKRISILADLIPTESTKG